MTHRSSSGQYTNHAFFSAKPNCPIYDNITQRIGYCTMTTIYSSLTTEVFKNSMKRVKLYTFVQCPYYY